MIQTVFSQTSSRISGKVLDKITKKPISFATIVLQKNSLGLYANFDGDFTISNSKKYEFDTIIITAIGYKKKFVPFKSLSIENNIIYLEQANETLKEVVISTKRRRSLSSRQVIRKAINKIPENYPVKTHSFISYYRDYLKRNNEYFNLNEGIVQTIDRGFLIPHYKNRFRLLEYKKNKDFKRISYIPKLYDSIWQTADHRNPNKFIPYAKLQHQGGNELFILLSHDPIRNFKTNSFSFIYRFSKDFLKNHSFEKYFKIFNDKIPLYKIDFSARKEIADLGGIMNEKGEIPDNRSHYIVNNTTGEEEADAVLVDGSIYINPVDFTIHKITYKGTLESNKKKIYELVLEYGYKDALEEEMMLKYISFNNEFFTMDHSDENYFKIVTYRRKAGFVEIVTNAPIDTKNATSKSYYDLIANEKFLKIDKIKILDKVIRIYPKRPELINHEIKINIRDVRDIYGRVINQKKVISFYQFRELFVQQRDANVDFLNKCFMLNPPLVDNCKSLIETENRFFMNTPLQTR